jgi:hypothetical protein
MSFLRHREIYPSDGNASIVAGAPAHRLDEFPAGYSSAGCAPALPASASPAGSDNSVKSSCRSIVFHRAANSVLTGCLSSGGKRRGDFTFPDTVHIMQLPLVLQSQAGKTSKANARTLPRGKHAENSCRAGAKDFRIRSGT